MGLIFIYNVTCSRENTVEFRFLGETTLGSSYNEVRVMEGSRNRDLLYVFLKIWKMLWISFQVCI